SPVIPKPVLPQPPVVGPAPVPVPSPVIPKPVLPKPPVVGPAPVPVPTPVIPKPVLPNLPVVPSVKIPPMPGLGVNVPLRSLSVSPMGLPGLTGPGLVLQTQQQIQRTVQATHQLHKQAMGQARKALKTK
ncbi:MAG: hypothetical protein QF752_07985, partial [Planctomycetota bacterium]|nr:hypothetical protein [Planctomycetota bacterium]